MIPANGVVMVPEASSGCVCPFPIHCTTVLHPREENRAWGMYSAAGDMFPIRELALNFGAPGDRRDADDTLWLAYPRPGTSRLAFTMDVDVRFASGGKFFRAENPAFPEADATGLPWVGSSGARGMARCRIPLAGEADGTALYGVRLHFAESEAGPFRVKVAGSPYSEAVEVAGGKKIIEIPPVTVSEELTIELLPEEAGEDQPMPVLSGVEIKREKVLEMGLLLPRVVLSDLQPEAITRVETANHTETAFKGSIRLSAPPGFELEPSEIPLELATGDRKEVPVKVRRTVEGKSLRAKLVAELQSAGGQAGTRREALLEYLGPRGRVTVFPTMDTYARASSAANNYATGTTLSVDGGSQKMGDEHHAVAYLRFPLEAPGKPVTATLRLFVPPGGHTQSADSGRIHLVEGDWKEESVNYSNRPDHGAELAVIGKIEQGQWVERKLDVDLTGRKELSVAIVPTSCDGATYVSSQGEEKPELVVEFEKE